MHEIFEFFSGIAVELPDCRCLSRCDCIIVNCTRIYLRGMEVFAKWSSYMRWRPLNTYINPHSFGDTTQWPLMSSQRHVTFSFYLSDLQDIMHMKA